MDKWLDKNNLLLELENEIGHSKSMDYKDWRKAASKSVLYNNFVENKIEDGEIASGYIGNMYTASIFMSLISLLYSSFENKALLKIKKLVLLVMGVDLKLKFLKE